ncbi:MAG TPA: hypothetical protein VLJ59_12150 [Mycobacteriales bacterium]|nr:hypothetical protein [Mycobacteriales bacterium]
MRGVRRLSQRLTVAGEEVERTSLGQGLISALILIILITGVVWNLPDSAVKRQVSPVITPIGFAIGVGQSWGVFAPNPPRQQEYVDVVVTLREGREAVWTIPHGDPVFGYYVAERWHKLKEYVVRTQPVRRPFARWVTGLLAGPDGGATRVRIVLRTELLPAPGSTAAATTETTILYDERLPRP